MQHKLQHLCGFSMGVQRLSALLFIYFRVHVVCTRMFPIEGISLPLNHTLNHRKLRQGIKKFQFESRLLINCTLPLIFML